MVPSYATHYDVDYKNTTFQHIRHNCDGAFQKLATDRSSVATLMQVLLYVFGVVFYIVLPIFVNSLAW